MSEQDFLPVLTGGDVELGNFIIGGNESQGKTDFEASRLLLRQVDGLPRRSVPGYGEWMYAPSNVSYGGYDYSGYIHNQ